MLTTTAALESLTDRARFELLATSILRKAEPRYTGIIHTGLNAEGETIVSPVDGLHLIPYTNPPHYVFVQHTTTDRARLRGKWLTATDADLVKAVAEAVRVRRSQSNAVVTVVLTTTQRVDMNFAQDVYREATTHNVVVDIWDQHRLADFLDTTPDGQWLRKYHLGVEANRLSADLLHQIGRASLALYRQEIVPPNHPQLIDRNVAPAILEAVAGGGLCLVVGRSGFGKSVATVQALQHWLDGGGLGFWLPARVLEGAASVEEAIGAWLRRVYPTLQAGAGSLAVELGASRGGLLLCLDDVNRASDAGRFIRLATSAAAPSNTGGGGSGTGSGSGSPRPVVVVPVWPEQLAELPAGLDKAAWIKTIRAGELLAAECEEIIRESVPRLSSTSAAEYANRLDHDPLLVGLFATLANDRMNDAELGAVADDAVGRFIEAQVRECVASVGADLLPTEFLAALNRVAHEMLTRRAARPVWVEFTNWFGESSQTTRAMRALIGQGRICRLDDENQLAFRHDRLRDRFLVNAASDLLRAKELAEMVIADPHYGAVVGKAIAVTPVTAERLSRIRAIAPWAIFEGVRHIGEPLQSHHEQVFAEAQLWADTESRTAPELVRAAVSRTLLETDSSRALDLIDRCEPDWILMFAGLRNGSASHGMRFVRASVNHDFEPGSNDRLRDRIIEHARLRHGPRLITQLRQQLSRTELPAIDVNAYLALLGHFQFAGFDDLIRTVWERHGDEVLPYAIWAAVRCPAANVAEVLGPLLTRFALWPVREGDDAMPTPREWLAQSFGWAFRRGITRDALLHLIHAANVTTGLRGDVASAIGEVDDPDAAEFVVRYAASRGGLGDAIGDGEPEITLRSKSTSERLLSLWSAQSEGDRVRVKAFVAWLQATGGNDLAALQAIEASSPLYRQAVQHRVKRSDPTAATDLISLLRTGSRGNFWWVMAHRVWDAGLRALASEKLGALKDKIATDFSDASDQVYSLAELLTHIPTAEAGELLASHWGHLKYSPRMVHVAFRIGTPQCVALAEESLAICPLDVGIFRHAFLRFCQDANPTNPITLQHLRNLEPHLDRVSEKDAWFLAMGAERVVGSVEAAANWIRTHLVPRLQTEDRARIQLSDEAFVAALDRQFMQTQFEPHLDSIFELPGGQRLAFPTRQLALLNTWLSTHQSVRGLEVAGECLRHIGTRHDLELLDRYPIAGDAAEIERVKASTRFAVRRRTLE